MYQVATLGIQGFFVSLFLVQGSGFWVQGSGFRVQGRQLRVQGPRDFQRGWIGDWKVDARLPGKGDLNSHGAKPIHLIITVIELIRTSRLSIKNALPGSEIPVALTSQVRTPIHYEGE